MAAQSQINLDLHKRQNDAFYSKATEILYGGAAGGGKSHLMRVLAIVACSSIPGLQVYLFRRLSDDLYKNHMEGAGGFYALLAPWIEDKLCRYNEAKRYIEFWNGSKIWLCHCQHEKDRIKYQGAEIHILLVDELTHFTEKIYRFLRGRCRLGSLQVPEEWKGRLPLALSGSNPGGIGHNWVKAAFVDFGAPMKITKTEPDEGGMHRQYIPALLSDNPSMAANDPDYAQKLQGLGDPALVKAMLDGDWDIVSGGALDDVWKKKRCIVPRFKVPSSWIVDRAFDWGSTHPFSVGWWAESDGTEAEYIDAEGKVRKFCPPKGSLIRIAEWYGATKIGSNKGLKLSGPEIAAGIKQREKELIIGKWITSEPKPGPADNQISDTRESDTPSIASKMAAKPHKIRWKKSDKSPGSRKIGLDLLRDRLKEAGKDMPEGPAIYFMEHCRAAISTLPVLPRDEKNPEDVDTNSEDHVYDEVRYRLLAGKRAVFNSGLKGAA